MTLAVGDLIQETTSTTGTGTLTLSGAVAGYQSFAVIGTGNTTYYCIRSGTNKEVGIGTYTASGTTLSRDTVLYSSAGGTTKITVGAGATVINTYPAETSVSGGGGGTYPTIQPTLNLDFANTKQLDPRITFVRNSTATYYDGQTSALAEQNLLLQSNTFSNAAWVATNGTVASGVTDPAGTTTAFSFTATGVATLYQTLTTTATPYTLSFYIQRVTGTGAVNLTLDGTILTPQTITGSWARYSVTATPTAASHTIGIQLAVITDSVNIFSSQLENRSSMTAANITTTAAITNYIPQLMTAPAGVARFDCDPITRNSLGLLIEESRTNLFLNSGTASAWTGNGNTTPNLANGVGITPDGTNSAINMPYGATGNTQYNYPIPANTLTYTCSFYAKSLTGSGTIGSGLLGINGGSNFSGTIFNFATLTTGTGWTATSIGNGWYRLSRSFINTSLSLFILRLDAGGIYTTQNNVLFWGAQLEAGSFATSYIPTGASTVTRAADQSSMTGTNFSSWYNQSQGSFCINAERLAIQDSSGAGGYGRILGNNGNTNSFLEYSPNATVLNMSASSGVSFTIPVLNTTANVLNTMAMTYSSSGVSASANGSTAQTNTTRMNIADRLAIFGSGNTTFSSSGHIRKLSYYPVALSSASLVALTS